MATVISSRGLWNVYYVTSCYLIRGEIIHNQTTRPQFEKGYSRQLEEYRTMNTLYDFDTVFGQNMRGIDIEMFVTNREEFGYLIDLV